ncbi:MAG: DUF1292 domain-containing protein [Myxococcota bacterium]|nr:DUF1292 domain-containing protein [Myxococcota bacterium]
MSESNEETIILVDAQGNEAEFMLLGLVELEDDGEFAMLTSVADLDADDDVPMEIYIFHYDVDEDGAESFVPVEDEELVERVAAVARPVFEGEEGEE